MNFEEIKEMELFRCCWWVKIGTLYIIIKHLSLSFVDAAAILPFQSCHGKSNPFVNPVIASELNAAVFGAENCRNALVISEGTRIPLKLSFFA
jgi:hypothetical protein